MDWQLLGLSFITVFLAEIGDKSQLAAIALGGSSKISFVGLDFMSVIFQIKLHGLYTYLKNVKEFLPGKGMSFASSGVKQFFE